MLCLKSQDRSAIWSRIAGSLSISGLMAAAVAVAATGQVEVAVTPDYDRDYPDADRWCPPIRSAFFDARTSLKRIQGKGLVRYQPNGGYGLPVIDKVDGQNLLHVGADLGWYQVGEPVFAVGNGVVRISSGPSPTSNESRQGAAKKDSAAGASRSSTASSWGNLVVVEHRWRDRNGETRYVTTVYGHLDSKRRVSAGDRVGAGQIIGVIGARGPQINGGYNPHIHFGVRQGRAAEIGAALFRVRLDDGRREPVKIAGFDESGKRVQLDVPAAAPRNLRISFGSEEFHLETIEGKTYAPSRILAFAPWPEFPIVGYALSTSGWLDPIGFLREVQADSNPAPFLAW